MKPRLEPAGLVGRLPAASRWLARACGECLGHRDHKGLALYLGVCAVWTVLKYGIFIMPRKKVWPPIPEVSVHSIRTLSIASGNQWTELGLMGVGGRWGVEPALYGGCSGGNGKDQLNDRCLCQVPSPHGCPSSHGGIKVKLQDRPVSWTMGLLVSGFSKANAHAVGGAPGLHRADRSSVHHRVWGPGVQTSQGRP